MDKVAVRNLRLCTKDCLCLYVCPVGATDTENSIIDVNKCIGCGICTTKCEFDAIHLHREHPECSKMSRSEDKFKEILPYAIKRGMKIAFGKKTPEEKASQKRHKAAKKAAKQAKKDK